MSVHYKGLSAVLSADLRSRATGGLGYLDGRSAVILDLVLEERRGQDLGLTGIAADLLKETSQKVILDAVDDDALTSLNVVLAHFTGHARYWALRRGGHHSNADPLKLAEWYADRPYELWYALQDRGDMEDVPYEVVKKLPPVGLGYCVLRFEHLRRELTPEDAERLYYHDVWDLMEDSAFHTLFDKDAIVRMLGGDGMGLDILEKTGGFQRDPPSIEWLVDYFSGYPQVLKNALRFAGYAYNQPPVPRVPRPGELVEIDDDDWDLEGVKAKFPEDVLGILRRHSKLQTTPIDQLVAVLDYKDFASALCVDLVGSLTAEQAAGYLRGPALARYVVESGVQDSVPLEWLDHRLHDQDLLSVMRLRTDFVTLSMEALRTRFRGRALCEALHHGGHFPNIGPEDVGELFVRAPKAATYAVEYGDMFHNGPEWLKDTVVKADLAMCVMRTEEFTRMDPDDFWEYDIFEENEDLFEASLTVRRRKSSAPPAHEWRRPTGTVA